MAKKKIEKPQKILFPVPLSAEEGLNMMNFHDKRYSSIVDREDLAEYAFSKKNALLRIIAYIHDTEQRMQGKPHIFTDEQREHFFDDLTEVDKNLCKTSIWMHAAIYEKWKNVSHVYDKYKTGTALLEMLIERKDQYEKLSLLLNSLYKFLDDGDSLEPFVSFALEACNGYSYSKAGEDLYSNISMATMRYDKEKGFYIDFNTPHAEEDHSLTETIQHVKEGADAALATLRGYVSSVWEFCFTDENANGFFYYTLPYKVRRIMAELFSEKWVKGLVVIPEYIESYMESYKRSMGYKLSEEEKQRAVFSNFFGIEANPDALEEGRRFMSVCFEEICKVFEEDANEGN